MFFTGGCLRKIFRQRERSATWKCSKPGQESGNYVRLAEQELPAKELAEQAVNAADL
jgi:hypothetical protein